MLTVNKKVKIIDNQFSILYNYKNNVQGNDYHP